MTQGKILFISDFAVDTGFAQVAHNIADRLVHWNISVLAINYYGDPHPYQQKYRLYNPSILGDIFGYNRVKAIIAEVQPDIIFIINDPWIGSQYIQAIGTTTIPIILYTPVDGFNVQPEFVEPLQKATHIVAYTTFAKEQIEPHVAGVPFSIIPHGVDTNVFYPVSKQEARQFLHLADDWFIVNITDRNALRKRIDLAFAYFSAWVQRYNLPDTVKIYYHGALRDEGWNIFNLASYYGVADRLLLTSPHITPANGMPKELMRTIYSAADVGMSTSMGEGWGLTAHERMACGVPMILPCHSAYAEWAINAVEYVTCTSSFVNIKQLNTIGLIADKEDYIRALHHMYEYPVYRTLVAEKGYQRATEPTFSWDRITHQFETLFNTYYTPEGNTNEFSSTTTT